MNSSIVDFFSNSEDVLDYVLKPLDHIRGNWDVIWDYDNDRYLEEEDSFGAEVNTLITEISKVNPPKNYHKHEDKVAFFQSKTWDFIQKNGRFWEGAEYSSILEQGSFYDHEALVISASGRIKAAIDRGQEHLDEMEEGHKRILCSILSIILYQRC